MSISSNRIKYLDKENKILVKDFKTLVSNAIYTDIIAPLLDSAGLAAIFEAYSTLENLANEFTSIYRNITDELLAKGIVGTILSRLDITDPRLVGVAALVLAIKEDPTGVKERFLLSLMDRASMAVFDNPDLLNSYNSITKDTATLITLVALNQMSKELLTNGFNYTVIQSTLTGGGGSNSNSGTSSDSVSFVTNNQQVTAALLSINPNYNSRLLNPSAGVATGATNDTEFADVMAIVRAFQILKVESYKVQLDSVTSVTSLTDLLMSTNFNADTATTDIVKYFVKIMVYQPYAHRALALLLSGVANRLAGSMYSEGAYSDYSRWYNNYMSLVAAILSKGLNTLNYYSNADSVFTDSFKPTQDVLTTLKADLNFTTALTTSVSIMRDMYNKNYTDPAGKVIPDDMIPLYMSMAVSKSVGTARSNGGMGHNGKYWVVDDTVSELGLETNLTNQVWIDSVTKSSHGFVNSYGIVNGLNAWGVFVTKNKAYSVGQHTDSAVHPSQRSTASNLYSANGIGSAGYEWDIVANSFQIPLNSRSSRCIVTRDKVYAVGLGTPNVVKADIVQNGDISEWNADYSLVDPVGLANVLLTSNKLYVIGGSLSTVQFFDIDSDGSISGSCVVAGNLPDIIYGGDSVVTKNRVYILGAWSSRTTGSVVYTAAIDANGTIGTWTTATSLPDNVKDCKAITTKSKVYILGGNLSARGRADYMSRAVWCSSFGDDGILGPWVKLGDLPVINYISEGHGVFLTKDAINVVDYSYIYRFPITGGLDDYSEVYSAQPPSPVANSEKTEHLKLCSKIVTEYYSKIDTRTSYDSVNKLEYYSKMPSFVKFSANPTLINLIPTQTQLVSYQTPSVANIWNTIRGKLKALRADNTLFNTLSTNHSSSGVLTTYLLQAYSLFELEGDYSEAETDNVLKALLPINRRQDAINTVQINPDCSVMTITR